MKLGLSPRARLVRRRPTGERLLVYPERALELNGSALEIVELLDGSRSRDEIVAWLRERHLEVSLERIEAAVDRVLCGLAGRALLHAVP